MLVSGEKLKDYIRRTNINELDEYPFTGEDLESEIDFLINCWSTEGFVEIWLASQDSSILIKEATTSANESEGSGA